MNFYDTADFPSALQETLEKVRLKNIPEHAYDLYARSSRGYKTTASFCVPIKDDTLLQALDTIDRDFTIQKVKFVGLRFSSYSFNDNPSHFTEYDDTAHLDRMLCYISVKVEDEIYSVALTELQPMNSYTRYKSKSDYDKLDVMLIYDAYNNPRARESRRLERFIKECRDNAKAR